MKKNPFLIIVILMLLITISSPSTTVAFAEEKTAVSKISINQEKFDYYKIPTDLGKTKETVKKNGKIKYEKSLKVVEKYLISKNLDLVYDLDNPKFQEAIKSLGTMVDVFKKNEQDDVVNLVKFIDLYENYELNERLKELEVKSLNEGLTEEEEAEVNSLLPVTSTPTLETNVGNDGYAQIATVFSNGYNNIAARDYAYKWTENEELGGAKLRNNAQYGYYSKIYGCTNCWNDCTNFVSQVLKAGGMKFKQNGVRPMTSGYQYWFYSNIYDPAYSWGRAKEFHEHWDYRTTIASSVSALQTGDVVSMDFTNDGSVDHIAFISKNFGDASSQKYLTQHSTDREEQTTLATLYGKGYTVWGFEMDKAAN